jgi:hypothetical protein
MDEHLIGHATNEGLIMSVSVMFGSSLCFLEKR